MMIWTRGSAKGPALVLDEENVAIFLRGDLDPLVISASQFKGAMAKANEKAIEETIIEIRKVCEGGN